jgi:hypothetical protein
MAAPNWKTDVIREFVTAFCAGNPGAAGNAAIKAALLKRFRVAVTVGQVAGALCRWGISRGGIRPKRPRGASRYASVEYQDGRDTDWQATRPQFPAMLTAEAESLDRLRLHRQIMRHAKARKVREPVPVAGKPSVRKVRDNDSAIKPEKQRKMQLARALARHEAAVETLPALAGAPPAGVQPSRAAAPVPMPSRHVGGCQYILDGSTRRKVLFCGRASVACEVYCDAHCLIAYPGYGRRARDAHSALRAV